MVCKDYQQTTLTGKDLNLLGQLYSVAKLLVSVSNINQLPVFDGSNREGPDLAALIWRLA